MDRQTCTAAGAASGLMGQIHAEVILGTLVYAEAEISHQKTKKKQKGGALL